MQQNSQFHCRWLRFVSSLLQFELLGVELMGLFPLTPRPGFMALTALTALTGLGSPNNPTSDSTSDLGIRIAPALASSWALNSSSMMIPEAPSACTKAAAINARTWDLTTGNVAKPTGFERIQQVLGKLGGAECNEMQRAILHLRSTAYARSLKNLLYSDLAFLQHIATATQFSPTGPTWSHWSQVNSETHPS